MTIDPIANAPWAIQLHLAAALAAFVLGPFVFMRRRKDRTHRLLGYTWVMLMATTAGVSFLIRSTSGSLSFIHILSAYTLFTLWFAVRLARRGEIARHRSAMRQLYFWVFGVAGALAFMPGRRLNEMFFDNLPVVGFAFAAGCVAAINLSLWWLDRRQAGRHAFS